jgi:hypothetical protein
MGHFKLSSTTGTPTWSVWRSLLWSAMFLLLAMPLATCGFIGMLVWQTVPKPPAPIPFSADSWHAPLYDENGFTGTRWAMVDDLLHRYDFRGWTELDVIALLGEPMSHNYYDRETHLVYDLRDELKLLIFRFDSEGRVVRVSKQID